ncbi:carbamoyl phosphate synthase-like protein [Candidatus Nanopelagicaceae bacterium]
MRYLVVVPGGYWQQSLIQEAKNQGFTVIVVDSNPNALGFHIADHQIVAELEDFEGISNEIRLITNTIVGAVSFCSDVGVELSFYLNQLFQVQSQQFLEPINFVSKSQQRKNWAHAKILQPNFKCFDNFELAIRHCRSATLPMVVKPVDSSGSRGVTILSETQDFQQALIDAFNFSRTNQVIVEEFMFGVEFTVEVFAFDGEILPVLITQKEKIQNATGTVSGFLRAIDPDCSMYSQIANLAAQAYSALGLRNGPGHLELIVDLESGPVGVVEAAARGGGFGLSTKLMYEVTGFDLIDETLKVLNGNCKMPKALKFKPGALFFFPSRKGRLVRIEGLAESRAIEGVDISVLATIGSYYQDPTTDADRLCAIVVTASSTEELDNRIQLIRERLRFVFDDK